MNYNRNKSIVMRRMAKLIRFKVAEDEIQVGTKVLQLDVLHIFDKVVAFTCLVVGI